MARCVDTWKFGSYATKRVRFALPFVLLAVSAIEWHLDSFISSHFLPCTHLIIFLFARGPICVRVFFFFCLKFSCNNLRNLHIYWNRSKHKNFMLSTITNIYRIKFLWFTRMFWIKLKLVNTCGEMVKVGKSLTLNYNRYKKKAKKD